MPWKSFFWGGGAWLMYRGRKTVTERWSLCVCDKSKHQVRTFSSWQPLSTEKNWSWPGRPLVTSDPDRLSYSKPTDWLRQRPCTVRNSSSAWTRPWMVGPRVKLLPIICTPEDNNNNKTQSETADFAPDAATWRPQPKNIVCHPTGATTRRTGWNIRVIFDSGLFSVLYENMTSSTKQEVHKPSHCYYRRTEPRPQVTFTKYLVKFVFPVF